MKVALERFTAPMFAAPHAMWLADAFNLDHGPQVVSVRAQLADPARRGPVA